MSIPLYSELWDNKEHPDYERKGIKPPSREAFLNETRFITLRSFPIEENQVIDVDKILTKYCVENELGDVIWPCHPMLFVDNFDELIQKIKDKGLYLFDIWGYVPGSGIDGNWKQFRPDLKRLTKIEQELGEKWLGMDVGEQDGRYVLSYSSQMAYPDDSNKEQYLNFQRHIQKICDDLGNKMVTLLAVTLAHNEIKENGYTLIGAETAQMHPNGQVFYAYLRGAGKQYGVLWFGNASIYNRWGYKSYETGEKKSNIKQSFPHGPRKGTSLSLLKRLIYSHIFYNCALVGYESNWFESIVSYDQEGYEKVTESNTLSPIGEIQKAAYRWVKENKSPGTMITQVGILRNYYAGWSFPNYNNQLYRIWGNKPYENYDYFTDNLFQMFYPGYQNSSFFEDETGFLSPTPYGDMVDCLADDVRADMLRRYPVIVVASKLYATEELKDKLESYIKNGGHLVVCAETLIDFNEIAGMGIGKNKYNFSSGTGLVVENYDILEENDFELYELITPKETDVLISCGCMKAVVTCSFGLGKITVFASPFGIGRDETVKLPITCEVNKKLLTPYPMLKHVEYMLDNIFKSVMPFDIGNELSLITCKKSKGNYTLGIFNNSWEEKELNICSNIGTISKIEEIFIDDKEKSCEGYYPECITGITGNTNIVSKDKISGGDIRIFSMEVEEDIIEIPYIKRQDRDNLYTMILHPVDSIKDSILLMPTFFEHFDSVIIDWRYIDRTETTYLYEEGKWLRRQGIKVFVDLSSGLNLYPDLRLVNNDEAEYKKSMDTIHNVMKKMHQLGSYELFMCLHRMPENNITYEKTEEEYTKSMKYLCDIGAKMGITLHLKTKLQDETAVELNPDSGVQKAKTNFFDKSLIEVNEFITGVNRTNLKLAASTALLLEEEERETVIESINSNVKFWLVSTIRKDVTGRIWNTHAPINEYEYKDNMMELMKEITDINKEKKVVLDVHYEDWNQLYRDLKILK